MAKLQKEFEHEFIIKYGYAPSVAMKKAAQYVPPGVQQGQATPPPQQGMEAQPPVTGVPPTPPAQGMEEATPQQ